MQSANKDLQDVDGQADDQIASNVEEETKFSVTLQQMKDMTTKFKAQMRLQQEPIDHLTKIIELLEHVDQDQHAVLGDDEERIKYFYKDLMGFTQTLAQFIKINLTKPDFLKAVRKLPNLLARILVKNIENQELFDSMRWVFDHKCRLYQHHCLSEENSILIDNSHSQMSDEEREWREKLKIGDQIDAIKIDPEQRVKCWMSAQIQEIISEKKIKVAFPKDTHLCSRELSIYSNEIAKSGQKSAQAEDWREALQLDDKVDCYDSTGYWYASHIIAREDKEHQMSVIPMVQIAFRIYHPEGDKSDKAGRKFFGWEEAYDEWFPLYSARIDKHNTHTSENIDHMTEAAQNKNSTTKASTEAANDFEVADELDDLVSVIGENKIFAVQRAQCRSDLLIDFLNLFGNLGGFEKMLATINNESQQAQDINLMGSYINCLGKSAPVFHKKFAGEFILNLEQTVRRKMLRAETAQLRVTKKERFDDIIDALYDRLMPRVKSLDKTDLSNQKTLITCEIGKLFLRQSFLERRIDGLKLLSDVAYTCGRILEGGTSAKILTEKQVENAERKVQMVDEVLQMICKEGEVLNEIFSKQRTHGQLVQRSEKLLSLLMTKELLKNDDRKLIWNASEVNDGDMRVELFKVLSGGAQYMKKIDRMFFLDRVNQVGPEHLIARHIELITEICTTMKGQNKSDEVIFKGLDMLWAIVMKSENKCPLLIVNRAALSYSDILSRIGIIETIEQTNKLAETIKTKKMGYVVVKILSRVLKSSFGSPTGHPEIENVNDMIDHLEQRHNLLQLVIEEFQSYMKRVREEVKTGREDLQGDLQGKVIVDLFMHSDQITERIEFIKYYASRSPKVRLTSSLLNILWDELVTNSIDENDSQLMFKWLREVCDQASSGEKSTLPLIPQEELVKFYHETMNIENKQDEGFKDLSIEGFYCIQSFIVLINMINKKLIKIGEFYGVYKSKNQPSAVSAIEPEKPKETATKEPTKKVKITAIGSDGSTKADQFSFTQAEGETTNKTSSSTGTGPVYGPHKPSNTSQANDNKQEDPEELTIKVLTPPINLDGYDLLWRIATESTSKMVIDAAARILVQMHSRVTYEMQPQIPEFDQMFIDKCIEIIQQQIPEIQQRQKEDLNKMFKKYDELPVHATTIQILKCLPMQERKMVRSVFLLRQLVRHSEKWGTHSVKPHSSLKTGKFLPNLQIANNITGDKEGFPKRLEIGIDSNATLWDLKKLIGEKIIVPEKGADTAETRLEAQFPSPPVHPVNIRVLQMSCQQDLKDPRNGAVLSELRFKTNENLAIYKKRLDLLGCEPIVEDNEETGLPELSYRAKQIIEKIFREYCQPGGKPITQQNAISLINRWNGNHLQKEDPRSTVFMNQYGDKETKELTLDSLQQFMLDMAIRGEDLQLRMGLKEMGYAKNLMRLPRDGDPDDICQLRPGKEQMPRYMIANNEAHFDVLMHMLEMHKEVHARALEMVQTLATCPKLYERVLRLNQCAEKSQDDEFDWGLIFDATNVHKKLYSLEIIEAILVRDQEEITTKEWLTRFLQLRGFEQLQNLLTEALDSQSSGELASDNKKYVDQLFQLIRIFVVASSKVEHQSLPSQAGESSQKQSENKSEKEDAYTTPKKNIKPATDKVAVSSFDVGEITQEALFGETDPEPEQEQIAKENEPAKNEEQEIEKEKDSLNHLRTALNQANLAELVIQRANVPRLQDQVIKVVSMFLNAEKISYDDRHIIESAMSLWSTLLQEQSSQQAQIDPKAMLDPEFILNGLLECSGSMVRSTFHSTFQKIAQSQVALRIPLIEILNKKLLVIEDTDKNVFEYFGLLDDLVRDHLASIQNEEQDSKSLKNSSISNNDDQIEPSQTQLEDKVLQDTLPLAIELLKNHKSTEKTKASDTDRTLRGLLIVIAGVLESAKKNPILKKQILARIDDSQLIDHILNNCLFRLDSKPTEEELAENLTSVQSKCQTSVSRQSAFKVMSAYIEYLEPKEMVEFLENQIKPIIMDVQRPQKWRHLPSSKSRVLQHVGIVNLGCICYMISMLQQLYMVPEFRYQLMKAKDTQPENIQDHQGEKIDDRLLTQLQKLFGFLELSERHAFNPKHLCFSIKDYDGTPIKIGEQKDSQEFVGVFFERLETLLKPTTQRYLLQDTFQGNMCSQFICQSCGKVKNRLELFYTLSLQVKNCTGIADSLSQIIKGQTIEDFQCDGCNKKVDVLKRSLLADMPNVLIVHLQRIVFSFDTFQNDKVNSRFEFPNVLDLKEFSYKHIMKDSSDDDELKHLKEFADDDYLYRLVGVNIHVGTADHGHYYSIINTKRGSAADEDALDKWKKVEGDPWREFNDSSIKTFNFNSEMKNEAFGGDPEANKDNKNSDGMTDADFAAFLSSAGQSYGKSAYMLIYDRKSKKHLREVTVDAPDNAEASLIPFNEVQKSIPSWISELTGVDNKSFMVDAQLFNEDFFEFMKRIFKQVGNELLLTSHRYDWDYRQHFQNLKRVSFEVGGKLIFDMLSYYDKNAQLADITASFGSLLTFSDGVHYLKSGDPSAIATFIDKYFIDDRCSHLLDTLFTCTDATSRRYIAQIVGRTIQRLFAVYAECDPELRATSESVKHVERTLTSFMDIVLSALHTKDCAKNWTRLEALFQALLDIGKSSLSAAQHMLERSDIIADLIDFMLGHKSPRAATETEKRTTMGGTVPPPFQPLYTLVAILIRLVHTEKMDLTERLPTHGTPKLLSDHETFKTYFLSEEAHIMLTKTDFIEKVIFDGKYTENAEFSKALAHLCYKDIKFTRKVAKKLLKSISYSSNDEVQRHLVVVSDISKVKDEFQEQRLELLFGFAYPMHTKIEDRILQYGSMVTRKSTSEDVFQISSGLDARNHDDALLNLLWKYQGRMDSFTLTCLEFLGNLLSADEAIAEYFSNLAAPNYTMARYSDWMVPYLKKQLEETNKFPGTGTDDKAKRIVKVQGVLEKYQTFLAQKNTNEAFYVIQEALEEKVVMVEDIDDVLELTVTQIACKWTENRQLKEQNGSDREGQQKDSQERQELEKEQYQTKTIEVNNNMNNQIEQNQDAHQDDAIPLSSLVVAEENICQDLLYRLTIKNKHAKAVRIKMNFAPVDQNLAVNLVWPKSGVKDFIRSGFTSHILTLRKKVATSQIDESCEIDKLQIQVNWKAHDENDFEMSQYASQSDRPGKDQQMTKPSQGSAVGSDIRDKRRNGLQIDLKPTDAADTAAGDKHEMATSPMETGNAGEFVKADIADMPEETAGTRACPVCTLLNDAEAVVCDCCGNVLP